MTQIENVLAEFERRTRALPLGHKQPTKGASSYNWRMSCLDEIREIAAALPAPTGDVGELVEALRKKAFRGPTMEAVHLKTVEWKAADAITAQAAKLAELERERDETGTALFAEIRRYEAANARLAECERELADTSARKTRQYVSMDAVCEAANARAERLETLMRTVRPYIGGLVALPVGHPSRDHLAAFDAALSPAPATDIQIPKARLARDLDGVAADVAQMSTGVRESLEEVVAGSERDWTEDFALDNGNYLSRCVKCKSRFLGHKRRAVCKSCAIPIPTTPEVNSR